MTTPRILIVRLSAYGDVIQGVPVLCALRDALPEAFLAWVVEGSMGDVLEGHPALDELVRVPRRFWKSPAALARLRRRLRDLRFDITIDLQGLTKSALVAWLSGARRRIGKAGPHGRELSRWLNNELVEAAGDGHVVEHYLRMLRALDIDAPAVRFDLPERPADAHWAEAILHERGLSGRRVAILNAGAGWLSKLWPPERYGELARYLADAHGVVSIAAWGTPAERPLAEQIVATSTGHAQLAPPTTMRELAALCRRAALFVGSDTGPLHLAAAVGTPTISLHGASRADWCGAYGPQTIRLQARYEPRSPLTRRKANNAAMREITVAMVAHACDQLLAHPQARRCG